MDVLIYQRFTFHSLALSSADLSPSRTLSFVLLGAKVSVDDTFEIRVCPVYHLPRLNQMAPLHFHLKTSSLVSYVLKIDQRFLDI